ncbi:hypothetical protein ACWF94_30880 [Streptomyces sp. NPDC055078]
MAERPTKKWRARIATARTGTAVAELYTPELLAATDGALAAFDAEVLALEGAVDDGRVFTAVEHVVMKLNAINAEYGAYRTAEREDLCEYIDRALTGQGVDVAALAARAGIDRSAVTDRWRDW